MIDKEKSLAYKFPEIAKEWHPTKNGDLTPRDVLYGTHKKVWWQCDKGHEWQATVHHRTYGTNCPYCSNQKVLRGVNDLATTNSDLSKEWHPTKNGKLTPFDIVEGSNKRVWWQCEKGHEWQATVVSRAKDIGCPFCSNKKVLSGFNDLATTDPYLVAEWHPTKNGELLPTDITRGSGRKVWWKCAQGHEWVVSPNKRTSDNTNCPYCSNKKVLRGFNDLATTNPRLAKEWHPTKNGKLTPYDVTEGSGKMVWWQCEKGHEWRASIVNRSRNRNCPTCSKQLKTSFPEQALYYYIKKYFPDAENTSNNVINMELDIFIPTINTAIEYDGYYYHKITDSNKRELAKNKMCINKGIRLIRVREKGLNSYDDCICISNVNSASNQSINDSIIEVLDLLGIKNPNVDVFKDASAIYNLYLIAEYKNNLSLLNPSLATEWHPTKNGNLLPKHLAANSSKKVWWKCNQGHEWQASLHNRSKGKGCPYCSGREAISEENDLKSLYPGLVKEWDYKKNYPLLPTQVKRGSNKKVWWKCSVCGNEWFATINGRTVGHGCPKCGEMKKGPNRKTHEQFANELNIISPYIKLLSDYIVSTQKVKCLCLVCGHKWEALPGNLLKGKGCPVCARKRRNNGPV